MGGARKKKIILLKKIAIILGVLFLAVFLISPVLAQTPQLDLGLDYAKATGLANTDIRMIVAKIIRAALGLVGIVMIGFIIYAGWMYMTSAGNEEKIEIAKRILRNLVIGLAIILSALGIVQFVIQMILNEYIDKYGGAEEASGFTEEFIVGGFLGPVIESHYPKRNAPWAGEPPIPRNTKIVITFREAVQPSSLFEDTNGDKIFGNVVNGVSDQINSQNIKIYVATDGENKSLGLDLKSAEDDVYASLSSDKKTIVMKPKNFLGSPAQDTLYTVKLTNGIKWLGGKEVFTGTAIYYDWQFTVSTAVDLKPPQVESVIPLPSNEKYKRNIIVQISFNEAVDPISASGIYKKAGDFDNISANSGAQDLTGEFKITNQYKTIEFTTNVQCGVNSCGALIFCLPADAAVKVLAKAATIGADPPQAASLFAPDGVVDMANNSLDGGGELKLSPSGQSLLMPPKKDGNADGPLVDNFFWTFNTSGIIKSDPPKISAITPSVKEQNVAKTAPITITFNELMSLSSFSDLVLKTNKQYNVWYTAAGVNLNANDLPVAMGAYGAGNAVKTRAEILHGAFWQKPPELNAVDAVYYPFVSSKVIDIYQNCFYPAETDLLFNDIAGGGASKCANLQSNAPSCFDNAPSAVTTPCETKENCPFSDIQL